jgi:hypothetical protein
MKSLGHFLDEAKATYCGRCDTTHVPPSKGGTCPAVKEEVQIEEGEEKGGGYDGMPKGLQDRTPRGSSRGAMGRAIAKKERNLERIRRERALRKEEAEGLEEISKGTLGRYINKAKDSIDTASYRQGHKEAHGSSSKPLEKKLTKRHKGIETAVKKLTKEEAESIDEISSAKLRDYSDAASDARGHRKLPTAKLDQRYKSMALAHEKIRARHAKVAATEGTNMKTLSQFFEEANNNLFEADQIKAHHERVKKLKGKKVTFTHPVSKQKISGTMQKIVQMGGLPYAHVETGKSAHRVPVHQID